MCVLDAQTVVCMVICGPMQSQIGAGADERALFTYWQEAQRRLYQGEVSASAACVCVTAT